MTIVKTNIELLSESFNIIVAETEKERKKKGNKTMSYSPIHQKTIVSMMKGIPAFEKKGTKPISKYLYDNNNVLKKKYRDFWSLNAILSSWVKRFESEKNKPHFYNLAESNRKTAVEQKEESTDAAKPSNELASWLKMYHPEVLRSFVIHQCGIDIEKMISEKINSI